MISIVLPRVAQHGLTISPVTQYVIQLQCQTGMRPALAHKVGEKLPKSPSPTSQPETTATHHGFAPPFFMANKIQNQAPKTCGCSQYASCTCIQKPYIKSLAERRKLMTWSRVWALFPSTHSGIQPRACPHWPANLQDVPKQLDFRWIKWMLYMIQSVFL